MAAASGTSLIRSVDCGDQDGNTVAPRAPSLRRLFHDGLRGRRPWPTSSRRSCS